MVGDFEENFDRRNSIIVDSEIDFQKELQNEL
jgi:hypothetical protein